MDEFKDLDRIVLAEGETLLLRPKHPMPMEQMEKMQSMLQAAKVRAVFIAPDLEMFVGVNVVAPKEPEPEPDANAVAKFRAEIEDAYMEGYVIEYKVDHDWIGMHKYASPHKFDWERYEYRLPVAKG